MSGLLNNSLFLSTAAAAGGYQVERSLRFNSSDSAFCSRTPAVAGNRRTFTWAGWIKRCKLGSRQSIFSAGTGNQSGDPGGGFFFDSTTDTLSVVHGGATSAYLTTAQVFRDVSAWFHLVVAYDTTQGTPSNSTKIYVNGSQVTISGTYLSSNFQTDFNNTVIHGVGTRTDDGPLPSSTGDFYLADIHFIDGQALTPSSFTEVSATTGQLIPKAYSGSFGTNGFWLKFSDNSAATATTLGKDYSGNSNNWTPNNFSVVGVVSHVTGGLSYRDSSSTNQTWDASSTSSSTSNAIGPDRRWWVDLGSSKSFNRITFNVVASGQSADTSTNFVTNFSATSNSGGSTICGGGCTVTSASRPSGATPGTITVTFAGFTSQTGRYIAISSGSGTQGGTYTYSNLQIYDDQGKDNDSLVDTPTSYGTPDTGVGGEVRGNYATLNPLNQSSAGGSNSIANGNLDCVSSGLVGLNATIGVSSGKWYWETTYSSYTGASPVLVVGVGTYSSYSYPGTSADSYSYIAINGNKINNDIGSAYGNSFTTSDIIGIALDLDSGKIWFSKNGTWQNSGSPTSGTNAAFTGLTGTLLPSFGHGSSGGSSAFVFNAGQRAFAYTAPSGFKALCDTNLGAPLVAKPNTVFDVITYTGTGSSLTLPNGSSTPTSISFTPDFVWLKGRSGATDHALYDAVRGVQKDVVSNSGSAETTETTGLTAFGTNTLTVGSLAKLNTSSSTYVAWAWNAGGSTVSNTAGSITSQVRANPTAGFSVVNYTSIGAGTPIDTIGHGLGVSPSMVIVKNRDNTDNWLVTRSDFSNPLRNYLRLSTTAAIASVTVDAFSFSSTTVGLRQSSIASAAGQNIILYVFAPVVGYSSFGSYTGNGSSDGVFVSLGFRPRWLMIKGYVGTAASTANWLIIDASRDTYNVSGYKLAPNLADAENSANIGTFANNSIDILSNGFKNRSTNGSSNDGSTSYIFAAFAENPFQYARAR